MFASPAPPADLKDWAGPLLCERIFANMIPELKEEYREDEALKIWCVAVLRVCNPGARDYELEEMYESSFLSELHPGVALSKNTVSALHKEVGRTCSRIVRFMRRRAEAIAPGSHILLDGTLKSDESRVNSLSDFTRKARTKGTRDISVLYAFDMDKMEPVCSKCHPGNMLDLTAYGDFVRECGVKRGVIVADKGFPASAAAECRKECPGLHYLNPVRRNSALIATHGMLDFDGVLADREGISFRKARLLEKRTYSRTMALLRRAKKIRIGEHGEWMPVRMNPSTGKMLAALGLDIAASATPKRRPGRPPKIGTSA